jgi:AcrR family transcriptional regulator
VRYPTQHKDRTRRKIIESAAHLFSARGFAATSIEDIMSDCGLTRGAFYAHFQSKGQLYCEAIGRSCARSSLAGDATGRMGENSWVESVLRRRRCDGPRIPRRRPGYRRSRSTHRLQQGVQNIERTASKRLWTRIA